MVEKREMPDSTSQAASLKASLLDRVEEYVIVTLFLVAGALMMFGVICKYFIPGIQALVTQLSLYSFVYVVFIGLGIVVRKKLELKLDFLSSKYPQPVQKALSLLCDVLQFAAFAAFFVVGMMELMAVLQSGAASETTGIPLTVLYAGPVIGFGLAVIRYLQKWFGKKDKEVAAK